MLRLAVVSAFAVLLICAPACAADDPLAPPGPPQALEPETADPMPTPIPPIEGPGPKAAAKSDAAKSDAAKPFDRQKAADELLGRLAKAQDPTAAKRIANAVQALWLRSGSDTVDLLTMRSTDAQRAQKPEIAIKLMDEVVSLKPDFVEGWNRRATLRFMARDYDEAMGDIHEVLIREPRHFGAWMGLGRILADTGLDAKALAAYRKALEIYPAIDGLKKQVDDLTLKVEGQPI